MLKFIKTFYLWVGIFTLCNLLSLGSALIMQTAGADALSLYPVAWVLQFPLVLLIAATHYGVNHLFSFLPVRGKKPARFLFCLGMSLVFISVYVGSQLMYVEINSFIAWDALRVALDNLLQIIPDIGRSNSVELITIGILSIGISLLYTRRYHDLTRTHSYKRFVLICSVLLITSTGGFALIYRSPDRQARHIRKDLLPTTYLTLSIIDGMLPSVSPTVNALTDLVLQPTIPMKDFIPENSMKSAPSIFFIMLESVSWDHFGFTGYRRTDVTPNLNQLAEDSVVFQRAYAPANHSNYSQTSTHASQYPLRGTQLDRFEHVDYPNTLLFDILSYAGYQTAFYSAQNEDWQGMRSFFMAHTKLKHYFHSKTELGNNIGIESKLDDELVCTRAIEFADQNKDTRPLFMYINFQSTHFPYDISENAPHPYQPCSTDSFEFRFFNYDKSHVDQVINKYDNALHYTDTQIGAFIEYLKNNGLYENSLIIVAADHGEAFYKHGYPTHGTSLFEDQMRTTTIFKLPGSTQTGVRTDPISLIDINPTILEILGLPNHPNFQGQQVLKHPRKNPIYLLSHGIIKSQGIVDYPWKYFISARDGEWLLNLDRDPGETRNLIQQQPDELNRLKSKLETYRQQQLYYYQVLSPSKRAAFYPPQH